MIENISGPVSAPAAAANAAAGKQVFHTPFGDMVAEEMSGSDSLAALFHAGPSGPNEAPPSAQAAAPPPAPAAGAPTLASAFGDHPYEDAAAVVNPDGSSVPYNPIYFATGQTAEKVAALVGGTVVEGDAMASKGPYAQTIPNQMIRMQDGRTVNAGLIADFFNHGYSQAYINNLLEREIQGTI